MSHDLRHCCVTILTPRPTNCSCQNADETGYGKRGTIWQERAFTFAYNFLICKGSLRITFITTAIPASSSRVRIDSG